MRWRKTIRFRSRFPCSIIADFETAMASWTISTSRLRTSRVTETPNRLNWLAKEVNNKKKLRNEDWYSAMRFVRNWTRDSKPVTRDLLGSSRTFDSENKRPTRFNLVFKVSRSVENFSDRFRWRKTNKQKTNKSFRAHQKCLFHEIQKKKNRSENFFWSGPVAYNHLLFRHGDLGNSMLWSKAPTKKRKLELIEDSFGLTSNAVSFLWQKASGTCKKDNGQRQVSSIDRPSCLSCVGFGLQIAIFWEVLSVWRCRCSVYLNIENKQFYKPAPLVAITWGSV